VLYPCRRFAAVLEELCHVMGVLQSVQHCAATVSRPVLSTQRRKQGIAIHTQEMLGHHSYHTVRVSRSRLPLFCRETIRGTKQSNQRRLTRSPSTQHRQSRRTHQTAVPKSVARVLSILRAELCRGGTVAVALHEKAPKSQEKQI
jgi:hypothetical protein